MRAGPNTRRISTFVRRTTQRSASGFTLIELMVASLLMMTVVVMTARPWRSLMLSMGDLTARSETAEEMRFLMENLSRDFGPAVGATALDAHRLLICQDGGPIPDGIADWGWPDTKVEYYLTDGQLRRLDRSSGVETTVANGISTFSVARPWWSSTLRIEVTLTHKDLSRRATLLWSDP